MRVVSFDFEMSGLNADFGVFLCGCFKVWRDTDEPQAKLVTYRMDEQKSYKTRPWEDKELAIKLKEEVEKADIIVGWNSKRFDIPFLNARLAYFGESPVTKMKHVDLMYQARYKWRIHSARLDSVLDFLQAPDAFLKTKMKPNMWIRAVQGEKAAMDYVVNHCVQDVKALDWVYHRMRHLVGMVHP